MHPKVCEIVSAQKLIRAGEVLAAGGSSGQNRQYPSHVILLHVEAGEAWKLQKGELGGFEPQSGVLEIGELVTLGVFSLPPTSFFCWK
jgi:hypothetical protein